VEVPDAWIKELKAFWWKLRVQRDRPFTLSMVARADKKRRRSRGMDGVSALPVPVLWLEAHDINGTASLPDEVAALLRFIRADGGVSKTRVPVVFALMYTCMFRAAPPKDLLVTERNLGLGYQASLLMEEVKERLDASPVQRYYSIFDDTHYSRSERHVFFLNYFDVKRMKPVSKLVSLKPTPGADAVANAKEDLINIKSMDLPVKKHGGATADHHAGAGKGARQARHH
jgi:hypothetical protein